MEQSISLDNLTEEYWKRKGRKLFMRWISVKEWLPQEKIRVLVYYKGSISIGIVEIEQRDTGTELVKVPVWTAIIEEERIFPSHWTLLPQYPSFQD